MAEDTWAMLKGCSPQLAGIYPYPSVPNTFTQPAHPSLYKLCDMWSFTIIYYYRVLISHVILTYYFHISCNHDSASEKIFWRTSSFHVLYKMLSVFGFRRANTFCIKNVWAFSEESMLCFFWDTTSSCPMTSLPWYGISTVPHINLLVRLSIL